jgi:hypothetical protein
MVLVTPTAEVSVMGTRLALSAIGDSTKLSVADGEKELADFARGHRMETPPFSLHVLSWEVQ